jgi:hypothetical protein
MISNKYLLAAGLTAVISLGNVNSLRAADPQVLPTTAPAYSSYSSPTLSCPTCGAASSSTTGCKHCQSCGSSWFHHHDKGPYVVNLCPGACFGYFQTQWKKWDEVCPYPYQGIGVSDAPKPPAATLPPVTPKSSPTLPSPRQVEPKPNDLKPMSSSSLSPSSSSNTLPTIPLVPGPTLSGKGF